MVAWPSSRCSSADAPDSPGCTAWLGWASCCGSPSSTIDRAPRATATALASENCPASSTTSTSTDCATSERVQNHAVPPTKFTSPASSFPATTALSDDQSTSSEPQCWLSSHFCSA